MKVALAAFGRLKNRYAKEWVEHHKQLGFNHYLLEIIIMMVKNTLKIYYNNI